MGSKVVKVVKIVKVSLKIVSTSVHKETAVRWTGHLARTV